MKAIAAGRYGYAPAPPLATVLVDDPTDGSSLSVTRKWVEACFVPAFVRARNIWGFNPGAIRDEILGDLTPQIRVRGPFTGAEMELRRRIEMAIALIFNEQGAVVPLPSDPRTPRPTTLPDGPPWYRALQTGWAR